ncbi:MAG: iron-sulfur cluster-binding domain-containing protein [Lachnospiraceae bacterium]|nr:iron-sulfur cluster-binding domain-containing protein [Lachnospiraceae bacterium]
MIVKGFLKDVGGASRVTNARRETYATASPLPDPKDPIRALADALHPGKQEFKVTKITDASPTSKTFRLEPLNGHVPVFQSGQYINFYLEIGTSKLTRAYSLASAPFEARLPQPFVEITIRRNVSYFVPDYFFDQVKEGTVLTAAMPFGNFYYEPLRDSKNIVALAGGSGITPFVSLAKEIAAGKLDVNLTILYGSVNHKDIVCGEQLAEAEKAAASLAAGGGSSASAGSGYGSVRVIHVMSDDPEWDGEKGFVTKELIEKYSAPDSTYMFCGPWPMYNFVTKALKELNVPARRFRHDVMQQPSKATNIPGFPEDQVGKVYKLTVVRGIQEDVVDARADEPVAVALERSAIAIDTHCRGGECGFCRSKLLAGDLFISPLGDGRRAEDKEQDYFHACSAYPMSDCKVKIPIM